MSFGDAVPFGDMGWTATPAVMTTAAGTGAGIATGGATGSAPPGAQPTKTCALCNNPHMQEALFFGAILLIGVGWHFHLYSLLEEG